MSRWSPQDVEALLAETRRVVSEAKEAMAEQERTLKELNIDPRESLEALRKLGGDEAVAQVQAQLEEAIRNFEEEVERENLHAPKVRQQGRRPRNPTNMV